MRMMHTPASSSPERIARSIGAAPRQRGSSEACTFRQPCAGMDSTSAGSSMPYAATQMTSGWSAASACCSAASRSVFGVNTGTPRSHASRLHRRWAPAACRGRARRRGACKRQPRHAAEASLAGTDAAKSGVPMNTMRMSALTPPTEVSPRLRTSGAGRARNRSRAFRRAPSARHARTW